MKLEEHSVKLPDRWAALVSCALLALFVLVGATACVEEDKSLGEEIEDVGEEFGDEVEDAADEAEDAIDGG